MWSPYMYPKSINKQHDVRTRLGNHATLVLRGHQLLITNVLPKATHLPAPLFYRRLGRCGPKIFTPMT